MEEAQELVPRLREEYHRAYHSGIICERKATAYVKRDVRGTGPDPTLAIGQPSG